MTAEIPATAEGDLSKTPLAHLCVYMLEKELTGVLFLNPPNAETHVVRFIRGVPVKTRPGDPYMLLGKMLIDAGHIDKKTLDNALAANGRLGDVLMLSGRLDPEVLDATLEAQFLARMVRLYSLPPETTYQYFDGHEELASWGGAPSKVDPFALLWAGIAAHGDKSTRMDETLAKLSGASLTLHEKSSPLRFGFDAAAREVVDLIALDPTKLEDLAGLLGKEEAFVRRVIYALLILRQIPIRDGVMPVQPAESIA